MSGEFDVKIGGYFAHVRRFKNGGNVGFQRNMDAFRAVLAIRG